MNRDRLRQVAMVVGTSAALSLSGVVAGTAWAADPATCAARTPSIGIDDQGRLRGYGEGYCSVDAFRYFTGEIKWDKNFAPDPLTASATVTGRQGFIVDVRSCDARNTRSYYARTYWQNGSSYHDSSHRTLGAC